VLAIAGCAAAVVLVAGAGGAALCKYYLNCHLRGGDYFLPLEERLGEGRGETALPKGFVQSVVVRGLRLPTDFTVLSDGRMLIAQKDGLVRIVRDGKVLSRPFLDLRARVATERFRGIVGIEAAPDLEASGHVYVLYVQRVPPAGESGELQPATARLIRVTAQGDAAARGSERVILGAAGGAHSCADLPVTADCLTADVDHVGAGIEFASDGTLFVSTGDGGGKDDQIEPTAVRAQDVNALGGKVLHITPDGRGVMTNPFWNGDPEANRSKVWATGLRNPFRITLRGVSQTPYVGDVGSKSYEEIDAVPRGANLGWPCYEGTVRHEPYVDTPVCKHLYGRGSAAVREPSLAMGRDEARSVTGGVFYSGDRFPSAYRGAYIFGDWELSTLHVVRLDDTGKPLDRPAPFAEPTAGPVKLVIAAGDLYYLALNAGEVRRIRYRAP